MCRARHLLIASLAAVVFATAAGAVEMKELLTKDSMPTWEEKESKGLWAVEDGVLTCKGSKEPKGWFGSKEDYTDFIIDFEFKVPPGGNSGVFLRAPKDADRTYVGMEVQILDDYADEYKDILPGQFCGSLYKIAPASKKVLKHAGEWNHMHIVADGDHITVDLNEQNIVDANGETHPEILKRTKKGPVGFQDHTTNVWFRNIKFADLAAERAQRTQWWRDAKFGMFIHWGVYSVLGEGEWAMQVKKIPAAEYEKLPPQFNPTEFDAAAWAGLAKRAGVKYVVITSKHHDGFAMFDSKVSNYDIVDSTPYKKDPMKPLSEECRKQGIKFGFYHSVLDWHNPDYSPIPEWDAAARAGHKPDLDKYLAYMQEQVRELCTGYGPLACIWWDGGWNQTTAEDKAKFAKVNAMIRELQPQILINNRTNIPEDFDTPEQYIPPTGITNADGSPKMWENCITLTTGHGSFPPSAWWGYDKNEKEFKTPEFCIRMLIDIVSKGGNLLLNVGPDPTGKIGPNETKVLEKMGEWLATNGEAIYGTTASPFKNLPFFGKATVRGNTLYLHVFTWPTDGQLIVPGLKNNATAARLLTGANNSSPSLKIEKVNHDWHIQLPPTAPDPIASVIALQLDGPPQVEPFIIQPIADGTIVLPALFAEIRATHGQRARFEVHDDQVHIGNWTNEKDTVAWQFQVPKEGSYEVTATYAAAPASAGAQFIIAAAVTKITDATPSEHPTTTPVGIPSADINLKDVILTVETTIPPLPAKIQPTGSTEKYEPRNLGQLKLPAGPQTLLLTPFSIPKGAALMNLRQITLTPKK